MKDAVHCWKNIIAVSISITVFLTKKLCCQISAAKPAQTQRFKLKDTLLVAVTELLTFHVLGQSLLLQQTTLPLQPPTS